jgi:hypothetical protein
MTPENPIDPDLAERVFGVFDSALYLLEELASQEGVGRDTARDFSRKAARAFGEGLILDCTVDAARQRMKSDRLGAVSFCLVAHEVSDRTIARRPQFVATSDGQHEPFLLVASAVLNHLDWIDAGRPDRLD